MNTRLSKRGKRRCGTCRHYQPSPLKDQGWCRNPDLRSSHERALVAMDEHRCARMLVDYWEAGRGYQPAVEAADAAPAVLSHETGDEGRPAVDTGGSRWIYWAAGIAVLAIAVLLVRLATLPTIPPAPALEVKTTPAPTRPAAPTPAPALPSTSAASFVKVAGVGSAGLPLRVNPSQQATGEATVSEGALLEVAGADVEAEGGPWRNLRDSQGRTGWVPTRYLQTKSPLPGESSQAFILRSDASTGAKRVADVPAAARLVMVDSKPGEIVDKSLPTATHAKWYWVKLVGTGETGWAYVSWVRPLP